ncbi:70 kDa peptidyl-prolyl isomerase-like [Iris pallida]|uniref:70 kDa peptidyl-prolyl isomerase-like n=1 Tax=Iris pallida TaxID=29817 RepID=A0AAX6DTZ8_IRIPA|nr:70 kDa peptidyl-prolyl isomerase-like [Iris pallida]
MDRPTSHVRSSPLGCQEDIRGVINWIRRLQDGTVFVKKGPDKEAPFEWKTKGKHQTLHIFVYYLLAILL